MAYATVTLSGTYQTPDGTPHKGHVEIIPSERVIKDTTGNVILTGRVKVDLDAQGAFTVALPATDDPTLNPTGFGYTIAAKLHSSHPPAVSFSLPASLGATTVEDLTPVDPSTFAPTTTYAETSDLDALAATIPTTPADVGAEPAGLSQTTHDALADDYARRNETIYPDLVNDGIENGPGDFTGTDNSPALQAAFDALPADGGTIEVGPGVFLLATDIVWPHKPIRFIGQGKDRTKFLYTGTGHAFDMSGSGTIANGDFGIHNDLRYCHTGRFTVVGTSAALSGIRLRLAQHDTIESVRAYGFSNNGTTKGAAFRIAASYYCTLRDLDTWAPDRTSYPKNFYGAHLSIEEQGIPPYFCFIENSSLYWCDRGAQVLGNNNVFSRVAFEKCASFGTTTDSGIGNMFLDCWWEGNPTGLRIGTTGTTTALSVTVERARFSSGHTTALQNNGKRTRILNSVVKSGTITESTNASENLYENLVNDDTTASAFTGITLLPGSGSIIKATGGNRMVQSSVDTPLTNSWTDYTVDNLSLTLPAGTWMLTANVCYSFAGSGHVMQKIHDGTGSVAEAEVRGATGQNFSLPVHGIVSPTTSTTYTVRAFSPSAAIATAKEKAPDGGATGKASTFLAVRLS